MKSLCVIFILLSSCASKPTQTTDASQPENDSTDVVKSELEILAVEVTGSENAFQFSVTIKSAETGCDQYADWWEVISTEETLLYRRILAHSHPDEQPFTRSGGPVAVAADERVIVRGHMNDSGYSKFGMVGTVDEGFSEIELVDDFGSQAEGEEPLPSGCAF